MIQLLVVFTGLVGTLFFASAVWVAVGYVGHWSVTKVGRPPLWRYLVAFAAEWWANVRTWAIYPVTMLPARAWQAHVDGKGIPIALVHGYMMNRGALAWMRRSLMRRGYANVVFIEPRPLLSSIETQADMLAEEVRRLSAWAGNRKIALVGHSQGGLVSRVAMVRHPDLPVAIVVSIGSPHAGTKLARGMRSPNGVQMRWQSPFLLGLPAPAVPYVSIYSDLDNIVFPKESSRLGQSIELTGLGHHTLCLSPTVLDHVVKAIESVR